MFKKCLKNVKLVDSGPADTVIDTDDIKPDIIFKKDSNPFYMSDKNSKKSIKIKC